MVWKNFTLAVVALVGAMSLSAIAQNGDNPSGQCSNCYVQMDGQQGGEGTSAGSAPAVQDAWDSAYLNLSTGALDALIPSDAAGGSAEEDLPSEGSSLDASGGGSGGGSVGWVASYQTNNYGLEMFGVNSNWSGGVGYMGTPAQRTADINQRMIAQTMPLVLMTAGGLDRVALEALPGSTWQAGVQDASASINEIGSGQRIGGINAYLEGDTAVLDQMHMREGARGLGLGSEAYQKWESGLARFTGVKNVVLTPENARSRLFFLRQGFTDRPDGSMIKALTLP